MGLINEFLTVKRGAVLQRRARLEAAGSVPAAELKAAVRVAGRSGVREIRIRDFQLLSDSPEDFAGHNLGPGSPELQLGVLGSCLSHITLIQAAERGVALDALEVEVTGRMHPLAGRPGYEDVPVYLHDIAYTLTIVSPDSADTIAELHAAVERACPILNLLQQPQQIQGKLVHAAESAHAPEPARP